MMGLMWVVTLVALAGAPLGQGLPLRPTAEAYPHGTSSESLLQAWTSGYGWYAAVPALALMITAVGFLFGCTWCYRHKDCKPNGGAENQLFTASATQLHDANRSQPPDSGFSEPANNNISEDNNNGPISLREMQNIANNNATAYIVSENEERNRSRESVVEFEPLPTGIRAGDPLEHCADWFTGEDLPRNRLQYLREIGRGWFGRVVEGEIEGNSPSSVAVKILNQNASAEERARFLDEARVYRDITHDNVLRLAAKCLHEDPWILIFELCSMDLQQYLVSNRPKMAVLNDSGVPLQLLCDVASALAHLHSRGYLYGNVSSSNVLVRASEGDARAVLGAYAVAEPAHEFAAPETKDHPPTYTTSSEVWSLGTLVWEVCEWGATPPAPRPPPPALPCPYRGHLYQVMQLCWSPNAEARPTAAQVHALLTHLHTTHTQSHAHTDAGDTSAANDFEDRWQRLKPNTIPKIDEHIAIVHAPSTSTASHFTGSDRVSEFENPTHDTLSVDMDTAVSRSSSIMSDKDPLSTQIKSESLTNLHGSLEDVRNIYLTHNETPALECHQGNIAFEEREHDRSDGSIDPWVKDLIAGSQDDVSYYRDVSDVIKNLDDILNSEKTSSSESSHQASPSRDNLSLDCKKEYAFQSSMVKSPGISNFKNILEMSLDADREEQAACDDDVDRDTIGTLSHSFERHSDTTSQHTLENLTPDTPIRDFDVLSNIDANTDVKQVHEDTQAVNTPHTELPKENIGTGFLNSSNSVPKESVVSFSISETNEQLNVREDCATPCDNLAEVRIQVETKSIDNTMQRDQGEQQLAPAMEAMQSQKEALEEYAKVNEDIDIHQANSASPKSTEEVATNSASPKSTEEVATNSASPKSTEEVATNSASPKSTEEVATNSASPKSTEEVATNSASPKSTEEVATNFVENEIIKPAIEIVSKRLNEDVTQNGKTLPKLELRENSQVEPVIPVETLKHITKELIEDEKKVFHEVNPPTNPEPVQLSHVIENSEPPAECEEEELAFSSNFSDINLETINAIATVLPTPDVVQNVTNGTDKADFTPTEAQAKAFSTEIVHHDTLGNILDERESKPKTSEDLEKDSPRSDKATDQSNESTVYMDLINYTASNANDSETRRDNVKDALHSCLVMSNEHDNTKCSGINSDFNKNDSTVYLDLPSVIQQTHDFLHSEREPIEKGTSQFENNDICASTPKGSECSTQETSANNDSEMLCETKVPNDIEAAREQKQIADLLSPFESPTKSHPTDTYEEHSSVVLGPFENCATVYKTAKTEVEFPKEELLAFSSNFNEINLETPSPLRGTNFLIEVPDIVPDYLQFDDITLSEGRREQTDISDESDQSGTTRRVSPSTPPNSPGIYLASTSAQKYLVDIDLDAPEAHTYAPAESDSGLSSLQKEIDMNQIELQITTKLAMAENENNLNIEYSGPLTVEGLVSEDEAVLGESGAVPEALLAGNGALEDRSEGLSLDEECVKALRNELELKLPLAQVAGIEPPPEPEWGELPPPPELVVSYGAAAGGALSPIAEETRHQLSAYENDAWNPNRTDSSESYPEPCNDSTAEVTDLPYTYTTAGASNDPSTYTILSRGSHDTYTVQKDIPTSRELTMSADSLNGSPFKKPAMQSPIDDRTYNKDDEKASNCERISQVSPFLMSPTTDTSAPDSVENVTGVSTLSKTSVPTDAKHSKPSELSKATSIDSWCSNDTLYNVEENFDDLAVEADLAELANDKNIVKSASTETLTRQDGDKEDSHCSTYIINDSKSDDHDSFSPDSITANDNYTYTKVKTEATGATASGVTKSDVESAKTQTKDLAYETLPSYSNCTTELVSGFDDAWKFAQPELVRRSPIPDEVIFSPPRIVEEKESVLNDSPQTVDASIKKMDSVELTCLQDDTYSHKADSVDSQLTDNESPQNHYKNNMAPAITSTPFAEQTLDDDEIAAIPMKLPTEPDNPDSLLNSIPNFQSFVESAENKPQDITCNQDTAQLLDENSKTSSKSSNRDNSNAADRTPTYSDFENSAVLKPQEASSEKSSQNIESGMSSGDFRQFEISVRTCPQDLSSIDASSLFLNNERRESDIITNTDYNRVTNRVSPMPDLIATISPSHVANLVESQPPSVNFCMFVTDLDEEETDQPHSIIITDRHTNNDLIQINDNTNKSIDTLDNSNRKSEDIEACLDATYDSHTTTANINTYDSHISTTPQTNACDNSNEVNSDIKLNGVHDAEHIEQNNVESPKRSVEESTAVANRKDIPNGTITNTSEGANEITCNGDTQNFATVNFIHEPFEEVIDQDKAEEQTTPSSENNFAIQIETPQIKAEVKQDGTSANKEPVVNGVENKVAATEDFLQNEKKFCTLDTYLPLLNDIRFTGPAEEIISTSFTQDSPTEPMSPECEQDNKTDTAQDLVKDWDSDSDSHDSNSSSGEFIWKGGDGLETPVVPSTRFDHQQKDANGPGPPDNAPGGAGGASEGSEGSGGSEGSEGSGSEGDEVEFVPSSWDCRAEPAKSSLRTLQRAHHAATDSKKRVVFKRQKYHCVYEYPRELAEADAHPAAYLPDFSTYCEWDGPSAEEAARGYGRLYAPLGLFSLRTDYDEDFFISSSARPFESLGLLASGSQFFPGMHLKPDVTPSDVTPTDLTCSPPPSPTPLTAPLALPQTKTPSLDFTTPDSGVEDITPLSTAEEDFKTVKAPENDLSMWKTTDSASSSESVSPSSPGGEALGGLRHTRDKLKLDLPPSPHIPSPRHNRVFNFVLEMPKRHRVPDERPADTGATPLVMTDDTPIITDNLHIQNEDVPHPEPTFSTFGKSKADTKPIELDSPEQKIILTDGASDKDQKEDENPKEAVKGEGTVLDSGDEDSGIESSSKATLERKANVS